MCTYSIRKIKSTFIIKVYFMFKFQKAVVYLNAILK